MTDATPLIAVDGATGYLGNHLVWRLRQSGATVRCIVHPGAREKDIDFLRSTGAQIAVASLSDGKAMLEALKGVDVAVHLIGSIAPPKGQRLEELHGTQTANLVKSAKEAGAKKIVQVTALGTAADAESTYHGTKWQAEEHVRKSGLKWVILRPSLIVGKQVGNRNSKLVARYMDLIRTRSTVPVIGGGSNRLQPVFIGDLAQALELAINGAQFDNQVFEIGGDEILSMRQIVEKLMQTLGTNKKISGVSPLAAGVLARICETVQRVPTISRDQVKLSLKDNVCSNNALRTKFGIEPTSMDRALATYTAEQPGGLLESSGNRR
jgi:NADH dehydrogenase